MSKIQTDLNYAAGAAREQATRFFENQEEKYMDIRALAAHFALSRSQLYKLMKRKGFPSHKWGRSRRFKISEVEQWLQRNRR